MEWSLRSDYAMLLVMQLTCYKRKAHRKRKILNKYGLFGKGCNGSTGLVYRDTFKPQNFGNIVHYTDETKVQMFGHLAKTKHDISARTAHNTCQAQRRGRGIWASSTVIIINVF